MADESGKQKRSANFSVNDCLLLADVMGKSADGFDSLTNYQLCRHKFTSKITSATKRRNWKGICVAYNASAEVPRTEDVLIKKWDNLVQTHRTKFFDFQREQGATGGGSNPKQLSPVTNAVMDVIGRRSENVVGVVGCESLDTSLMQIGRVAQGSENASCSMMELTALGDYVGIQTSEQSCMEGNVVAIEENNVITDLVFNCGDANTHKRPAKCSKCQCKDCSAMRKLKRRKLELQIKQLTSEQ